MTKCPTCQTELDPQTIEAGKCSRCGATLRKLPRRNIEDATHTIDLSNLPPIPDPPGKPLSPGERTITMGDQTIELGEQSQVLLPTDEPSAASPPESEPAVDPDSQQTFLMDDSVEAQTEVPGVTQEFDPYQTVDPTEHQSTAEPPPSEPAKESGDATVAFTPDQTIDFRGELSGDEVDALVTANWSTKMEGDEKDSCATIRQKETVHGQVATKSSVVVKSRQFHSGPTVGGQVISPSDAPDYELLNVIGEGGMGVVYAAKQSAIARTVAVKMLKKNDAESAEQRDKFISEAVVTGELDHPNIVPIYDLGSNDSGALFYSMKRVKGTPWNDVIKEKSLDENLNILLRVADAVAFAHANGVVHRDLKPENTMLGDYGEVLVMDWGLARISADFPNANSVSQSDVMGGTPAYMAPEMATGPIERVTIASDIYLLGAMLYEIVEGRTPHSGSTVMACLFAAAKNKISPPKQPGELSDIALKAMATEPKDRYATVRDFQDAIRQYQSHSESIVLTDNAAINLDKAREQDDYDLYSRSMYGFQEAVSMWSGNQRAHSLLSESRVAYASSALGRGDFELGLSLLDAQDPDHAEVVSQLEAGRKERESRQRRLKILKGSVAALIAAVIATIAYAYVAVSEQRDIALEAKHIAETERDRAETQEKIAVEEKERAEEAEKEAVKQKNIAEQQRQIAVEQKDIADAARVEAVKQKDIAEEQRQLADEARQREEYEAYVAEIGLASAKIEENAFDRAQQLLTDCSRELSRWEWGRLSYLCQLSEATWRREGPVEAIAWSPDGKRFASGDWAGNVTLWDGASGEPTFTLPHGRYAHTVAFDRNGHRLASGSSDHTIRVIDTVNGKVLQELSGHTDGVVSVRFSGDGRRLLSSSFDNTAILWDLDTGQPLQELKGHSWWVWSAVFSPNDRRIVTASQDGKAIVWQQTDGGEYRPLTEFVKHSGPINAAEFSPDGTLVATAGADGRVLVWNPDVVQPVDIAGRIDDMPDPPAPYRELLGHQKPVCSIAFSPDGTRLASGGEDNVIRLWRVADGTEIAQLRGHTSYVRDCVFSPNGSHVLSASRDQQIKLWNPSTYGESLALGRNEGGQHADAVLAARFSRNGKQIVTASRDRTARVWQADDQSLVKEFAEGHEFLASSAVFFSDGLHLATAAGDGTTRVWNVASGTEVKTLQGTGRTAAIAVSADNRWLATAGNENDLQLWDVETGKLITTLAGHEDAITVVAFAPQGTTLATGDERGRCRIWIFDQQRWVGGPWLQGHSRAITGLEFAGNGGRLVSASGDNTCGQWDVATGKELRELVLKHPGWVTGIDVSADGATALTICDDGLLRLWSLEDTQILQTIAPRNNVLYTSINISPDGNFAVAACAAEATVQLWRLDTGEEVTRDGEAWLDLGDRSGILWSAQFAPQGNRLLTVGGNDAQLWNVDSGKRLMRFTPHGTVASADISPDGRLLVTGSWDRSAKIWDVATGKALRKLDGVHTGFVNSVEFSPGGSTVLTASDDGTARLWNVESGDPVQPVFLGHASKILQAHFNHDGSRVLTCSGDKTARIWDTRSGESLVTLEGHQWSVLCGQFSAKGDRVVTGSDDDTAIVWDASTGSMLLKLAGHTSSVTSVAFSPDGERVLTGSRDSLCKLWDANTGKEILTLADEIEEVTSASFSPDGLSILTSDRNGQTLLWPALDWRKRHQ